MNNKSIKHSIFILLFVLSISFLFISCENETPTTIFFTVSFNSDGGTSVASQRIEKGKTAASPENPEKSGYVFSGWYNGDSVFSFSTPITTNITLNAKWTAVTNTPYAVKHYRQNTENNNYTLYETESKTGTTGTLTNATAKVYTGYTAQNFSQRQISADGNTVVEIYYNIRIISLNFNATGGTWSDGTTSAKAVSGQYGSLVSVPTLRNWANHTLLGWTTDPSTNDVNFSNQQQITYSDDFETLYAVWRETVTLPLAQAANYINNISDTNYYIIRLMGHVTHEELNEFYNVARDNNRIQFDFSGISFSD